MSVLTARQRKRGSELAAQENVTRWDWGDWALDVAGPVGEIGNTNGAAGKLAAAVEEIKDIGIHLATPEVASLLQYRLAADTIPPRLRKVVPAINAAVLLRAERDLRARHALIKRLAAGHPEGHVTVDAVRAHFGKEQTNTGKARRASTEQLAAALADSATCAEALAGLDTDALNDVLDIVHGMLAPESPAWAADPTPDYTIDRKVHLLVKGLHAARQTMDTYGVRSLTDTQWLRDALQQMADDIAALIAGVNDAIENESEARNVA